MSIAAERFLAPVRERVKPCTVILAALIAALAAAAFTSLAFCLYRAALPIEIDPNEAWNAWNSKALAHLYPAPDALTINNYPPLSFYFLHAFSLLGAEGVFAGRSLSILASLSLACLVYRALRLLGASRLAALMGAVWFLATLAGAYTGYVGMNDPHLLGLAVMCAGFVWFLGRAKSGRAAEPAILLMVLAGFIKHSLIALPASALLWLALDRPREAARAAATGAAACAAGLVICRAAYGSAFLEQLMTPRVVGWKNLHLAVTYAAPLAGAAVISLAWLIWNWPSKLARKMAVLLALTFLSGFVQSLGDGLDVNAYFEVLFALALAVGMACGSIESSASSSPAAARTGFAFTAALLTALAFSSKPEPYKFLLSPDFRQEVSENVSAARSEIKRVKSIAGNVSCSVMLICYWAGKPFVWDDFAMSERVATGRWTEAEMKRQARSHRIRFETIDDRAVW